MPGIVRAVFIRNALLYVLTCTVFILAFDGAGVLKNIRLTVLNRLRPDSFEQLAYKTATVRELELYMRYYKNITVALPERGDAWGLYGYCLYQLGRVDEAIAAYLRAAEAYPDFFWFYYNLGLLYFHQARYDEAVASLQQAFGADKSGTFNHIIASNRLYLPLVFLQSKDVREYIVVKYISDIKNAVVLYQAAQSAAQSGVRVDPLDVPGVDLNLSLF